MEKHHLANVYVSMQGNTFLEGTTHSQNGKPQPHAALYASIYLEYVEYSGMFYVFSFYVLNTETQEAQSEPRVQITAGRSIWL